MVSARPPKALRVLAVDNQDVVLTGLERLPVLYPAVVESVTCARDLAAIPWTADPPDAVILDYWLGRDDQDCLDAIGHFLEWGTSVVLYTTEEKPFPLQAALRAGVHGLSLKNDGLDRLVQALQAVSIGQPYFSGPLARAAAGDRAMTAVLTEAEIRVLKGLAYGLSTQEIADRLTVSVTTVRAHERSIHQKYRPRARDGRMSRNRALFEALRDGYWSECEAGIE